MTFRSRFFSLLTTLLLLPGIVSCQQARKGSETPTGVVTTIMTGTIVRVKNVKLVVDTQSGAFASMTGKAAGTIAPSIIAEGTQHLAAAAGSLLDNKLEEAPGVQIRVRMDDEAGTLKQITQLASPEDSFKVGQKVCISIGNTPGNVFPD